MTSSTFINQTVSKINDILSNDSAIYFLSSWLTFYFSYLFVKAFYRAQTNIKLLSEYVTSMNGVNIIYEKERGRYDQNFFKKY